MSPIMLDGESGVSVVIPVKNQADSISRCLHAVLTQSLEPREVIVVDGHSTDETVERAGQFTNVKVVSENHGTTGGARQTGLEESSGRWIAFTDGDCIVDERWLESGISILETRDNVAGVGGRIENAGEGIWKQTMNETAKTFFGSGRSIQGRQYAVEREVRSISGCNSIYYRDVIRRFGFNTKLTICEDTDLNLRLRAAGYRLLYTPHMKIVHNHKRGLRSFAKRIAEYGEGHAVFGLVDLPVLLPLSLPGLLVLAFLDSLVLPVLAAVYAIVVFSCAGIIAFGKKNASFLFSVPILLSVQYASYILGFWRGLLRRLLIRPRPRRETSEATGSEHH